MEVSCLTCHMAAHGCPLHLQHAAGRLGEGGVEGEDASVGVAHDGCDIRQRSLPRVRVGAWMELRLSTMASHRAAAAAMFALRLHSGVEAVDNARSDRMLRTGVHQPPYDLRARRAPQLATNRWTP